MSDNNIQNEQDLWDVLSEPVTVESKAPKAAPKPKPNPEGRFAKPGPMADPKPEPQKRKIDGFFLASMAGVAAVAVAATLLVSSMLGGNAPAVSGGAAAGGDTSAARIEELELENAELRAKLEQQKELVKDLQSDMIDLMGAEEYLATASTDPDQSNEVLDAQIKALDTLAQIQEAYADFDREKLEELIPQMDEQLQYLTPEALNNYYLILEFVEQPSND